MDTFWHPLLGYDFPQVFYNGSQKEAITQLGQVVYIVMAYHQLELKDPM